MVGALRAWGVSPLSLLVLVACSGPAAGMQDGAADAMGARGDGGREAGSALDGGADGAGKGGPVPEGGADATLDAAGEAGADGAVDAAQNDSASDAQAEAAMDAARDAGTDADAASDAADADADAEASLPPPAPTGARFTAYGQLQIDFDADIDPGEVSVTFAPDRPAGIAATDITAADANTLTVRVNRRHLPLDYTLTVQVDVGEGPVETPVVIDAAGNGSRVAFLSLATGSGDLRTWAGVSKGSTPLQAADEVCEAEALEAGFEGTFRAYLSTSSDDALCRVLGLEGKWSADCGQRAQPSDQALWLDVAGEPIVAGADAIAASQWRRPVGYFSDGTTTSSNVFAWLGTTATGVAQGSDCGGFAVDDTGRAIGTASPHNMLPEPSHSRECSTSHHLLCMQVDAGLAESRRFLRRGKRVFVTSTTTLGTLATESKTGVEVADAICQKSVAGKVDNPEDFAAWISDSADDALCRVLGHSGKVSANCGLAQPPSGGPWVALDGYLVAEDVADLTDARVYAPINVDESGEILPLDAGDQVYTGTETDGALDARGTCSNWSTTTNVTGGSVQAVNRSWTQFFSASGGIGGCTVQSRRLYCFER